MTQYGDLVIEGEVRWLSLGALLEEFLSLLALSWTARETTVGRASKYNAVAEWHHQTHKHSELAARQRVHSLPKTQSCHDRWPIPAAARGGGGGGLWGVISRFGDVNDHQETFNFSESPFPVDVSSVTPTVSQLCSSTRAALESSGVAEKRQLVLYWLDYILYVKSDDRELCSYAYCWELEMAFGILQLRWFS